MIDTTSVNFALNKVSEAWQKVAPAIQDVGEKYVRYVVFKEVISGIIALAACIILIPLIVWLIRKAFASQETDTIIVAAVFGSAAIAGLGVTLIVHGYDAALAITNPEMFTIHQLIESARGR